MCRSDYTIDRYQVSEVINTGTAGGLGEQLEVGDLVIADGAIQYDFDLTPFGYVQGSLPCSGQKKSVPSIFPTDKQLSQRFLSAAQKIMKTGHCTTGFVLTGDRFVSNSEYKQWLIDTFHGSAVEMEGGAIAQVCFLNQIPFTLVRAISDLAGKEANISFDTFELMAAELSANILLTMLSESENK
jgi:adenosylhomocysteine nucleosidase